MVFIPQKQKRLSWILPICQSAREFFMRHWCESPSETLKYVNYLHRVPNVEKSWFNIIILLPSLPLNLKKKKKSFLFLAGWIPTTSLWEPGHFANDKLEVPRLIQGQRASAEPNTKPQTLGSNTALPARRRRYVKASPAPALPETPRLTWLPCLDASFPHSTWTRGAGPAPEDISPEMPERRRKRKRLGGGGRGKCLSRFSLPLNHNNRRRAGVGEAAAEGRGAVRRGGGGRMGASGLPTAWALDLGPSSGLELPGERDWACGFWPFRPWLRGLPPCLNLAPDSSIQNPFWASLSSTQWGVWPGYLLGPHPTPGFKNSTILT